MNIHIIDNKIIIWDDNEWRNVPLYEVLKYELHFTPEQSHFLDILFHKIIDRRK